MAKQMAFYLNAGACVGCKACMIACKDKNALPVEINFRHIVEYEGGSWMFRDGFAIPCNVYGYSISLSCMHCQEPACVENCPTGASFKREDGVVLIDQAQCIGCRYCEWACPYGARHYNEATHTMTKCSFCQDLLAKGENPACVDACVMRALDFGDLSELRAKYGMVNAIEPLPPSDLTKPAWVVTPHPDAARSGQGTGAVREEI